MHFTPRTMALLALSLLLITAGCLGGGSNSPATTTTPGSEAADTATTGGDSGSDADATTTTTTTSDDATTPTGSTSLSALVDAHATALADAGSFTGEQTIKTKIHYNNKSETMVDSSTYNLDAGTANRTSKVTYDGTTTVYQLYTEGDTSYNKLASKETPRSETAPYKNVIPVRPEAYTQLGHAYHWSERYNLTLSNHDVRVATDGTTTFNGQQVTRYTITSESSDTLQSANGTLLVNANGVIVHANWTVTYQRWDARYTLHVTQTITDIGQTTVTTPQWVDDA